MRRRLFTIVSALSLLLSVATVVLWVRSYRKLSRLADADCINITRTEPIYWIISNPGHANLCRQVGRNWDNPIRRFEFIGIRFGGLWGAGSLLWNLEVSYWMILSVTLVLPAIRVQIWRRGRNRLRRKQLGLCHVCGYDLQATPDRCPECGTAATVVAENA